jgi:hypothetical protein
LIGLIWKHWPPTDAFQPLLGQCDHALDLLLAAIPAARGVRRRRTENGCGAAQLPAVAGVIGERNAQDVDGVAQAFIAALAPHRRFVRATALSASRDGAPRAR